jgi:hypothetical protein
MYALFFQVVSFLHFSHQNPVCIPLLCHAQDVPSPSHPSRFHLPNNNWCWSWWSCILRCRSAVTWLLGSGLDSRWGHECSSLVCCVGISRCNKLITHSEESYRHYVPNCDIETLNTRQPWAVVPPPKKNWWAVQIAKPFVMNLWPTVTSCLLYFPAVLECPQESEYLPLWLMRDNSSACSLLRF